jgi:hypothetical protein
MQIQGYIVRETEKARAFVAYGHLPGVKPLWVPKLETVSIRDLTLEGVSTVKIETAQDGVRIGEPVLLEITDYFAAKVFPGYGTFG